MSVPADSYRIDPGFYVYYFDQRVYDQLWTVPVRNAIISDGVIYWKSVDGAITAIQTSAAVPPPPAATATGTPTADTPGATTTPVALRDKHLYLPMTTRQDM
jgi:hypothetical protein